MNHGMGARLGPTVGVQPEGDGSVKSTTVSVTTNAFGQTVICYTFEVVGTVALAVVQAPKDFCEMDGMVHASVEEAAAVAADPRSKLNVALPSNSGTLVFLSLIHI